MTRQVDIEHLLDIWLDEGRTDTSDAVFDAAVARVYRQRQRPAWRVSWRDPNVNTTIKFAASAAVILIAVVAVAAVIGRPGGSNVGGTDQTPRASPTAATLTPAPSTRPWWLAGTTDQCGEAPLTYGCAGELAAGTQTSGGLEPAVTYEVPAGWVNVRDWVEYFSVFPDTPANRAGIAGRGDPVTDILILTVDLATFACDGASPDPVTWNASEIASVLAARDGAGDEPVAASIAGLSGWSVDIGADPDWSARCAASGSPPPGSGQGRYRVILLDTPDGKLIAVHLRSAIEAEFEPFVAAAMPIVETFEFEGLP